MMNCAFPWIYLRLLDFSGYGVAAATSKEFDKAFPDRSFQSPLVELLVKSGRNGNKEMKFSLYFLFSAC